MNLKGDRIDTSMYIEPGYIESEHVEYQDEGDSVQAKLCCLEGCLATSSVGFSFFVAMPTGILLVVQSQNDSDSNLVTVGVVLIIFPLIVLLIVIALCFNKKRLKRLGRNNKITSNVTYNNSSMEEPNCVKY